MLTYFHRKSFLDEIFIILMFVMSFLSTLETKKLNKIKNDKFAFNSVHLYCPLFNIFKYESETNVVNSHLFDLEKPQTLVMHEINWYITKYAYKWYDVMSAKISLNTITYNNDAN